MSGPFASDPGFEETQSFALFVQSPRFDRTNLGDKAPNFLRQTEISVESAIFGEAGAPSLSERIKAALAG